MRERAGRVSDAASRALERARRVLKRGALLLLVLGLLTWSGTANVRAQDRRSEGAAPRVGPSQPTPAVATPARAVPAATQSAQILKQIEDAAERRRLRADAMRRFGMESADREVEFYRRSNTSIKDLLLVHPGKPTTGNPLTIEDLARVPEVELQKAMTKDIRVGEAREQTAYTIARINQLNSKGPDAFLEALRDNRIDLAGLPFAMGDACRTTGERRKQFARAVDTVRIALPAAASPGAVAESFWEKYQAACIAEDRDAEARWASATDNCDRTPAATVTTARIAALMQVLAPESPALRMGLVKHLATLSHVEATRALARMTIFSTEDDVRRAAVDALRGRRQPDYTDLLLAGLRYPWPGVARHAAEAIVKLERKDLVPQLVALLDEPDPRVPVLQNVRNKQVPVVRELVRINHLRNCLLCHAPGNSSDISQDTQLANVPIPGQRLFSRGYGNSSPDPVRMVRIDVTYLRQDFSTYLPVPDASPWPEMQRFDFLTRTRVLSEDEAASYREAFAKEKPGRLSPYHRAALSALRGLTGRDAEPTAAAWRRLLALPAAQPSPEG
jgi:HEAT repeats